MGEEPPTTRTRSSTFDDSYDFADGDQDWMILTKTIPVAVNSTDVVSMGDTIHVEISLRKAAADGLVEVFQEIEIPSPENPRFLVRAVYGAIPVTFLLWVYDTVNSAMILVSPFAFIDYNVEDDNFGALMWKVGEDYITESQSLKEK